ncbi:palmitoyltransferase ZDHHC1/11 [Marchantia polymorpha subsp. ruderalis]|uniref:S-acyltransferase n=2 Tax=Marchantia polymorpha TaxID=3197 RepID=A0AAF6AVD1_MARPO|nr:hypothetical protein MARPO_0107s0005 [Marchantia polymorpha]BBN00402.1 hypothetical protein Mp_1g28880 [Marchantia polymorpha subsp. ruderalis]|eukprot:PTQ31728.1 hypothetical protein MARPO_0107s0005 [Marchantia polymorpha]
MRHHGWQLPYHPLQIVAVAVFSALAFSFYVFFVPFLGSNVLKFHVVAGFSPLVLAVVTLYIRCAAIDPADSGIRRARLRAAAARKSESSAEILLRDRQGTSLEEDVSRSLQIFQTPGMSRWEVAAKKLGRYACVPAVVLWRCTPGTGLLRSLFLGNQSEPEKYIAEEELLFCSLCEAEIFKHSKHCRACDKCVDGFDHHCRWLNNCIGKKNYKTFVAVMVASLLMLITQWSIGIFVLVRCFRDKHKFDEEIVEKLGSSFSRVPFVVVVTLCTFLAMLATLPLTQLLFFHLILIKKGITTYDYIVAIREQDTQEAPGETHLARSLSSSPASSTATAVSNASSIGALQRAVWCTPPRMFVENQSHMKSEVVVQYATSLRGASLRVPSLVELESGSISSKPVKDSAAGQQRRPVGLSPWKLARLSTKDASKAAVRAREKSSILRPVKYIEGSTITETEDSSFEHSAEIATTSSGHKVGWRMENPLAVSRERPGLGHDRDRPTSFGTDYSSGRPGDSSEEKTNQAIIPLHSESRSPFRSRSCNNITSFAGPASAAESPDILGSPDLGSVDTQFYHNANQERSWLYRATSDGYEASGGESADDTSDQGRRLSQAWSKLKLNPSFISRGATR